MPGLNATQADIDQFTAITQATPEQARHFLSTGTNIEGAIEDFFASQTAGEPIQQDYEEDEEGEEREDLIMSAPEDDSVSAQVPTQPGAARSGAPSTTTGYTLDGRPVETALPANWGAPPRNMVGRVGQWGGSGAGGGGSGSSGGPRIATLGGMGGGGGDEEDESDDEENKGETTYAGGERSGLSIQNPGKPDQGGSGSIVDKILKLAQTNGPNQPAENEPKPKSRWEGGGNVLGTDDDPAPPIGGIPTQQPPPSSSSNLPGGLLASLFGQRPPPQQEEEAVERHLTFWRNGFSIEDGPLLSYDNPANQQMLEAIEAGRAPPSLFNVRYDQPLKVLVSKRKDEDWKAPPKVIKPFEGTGNRLGSPAPEVATSGGPSSTPAPTGILHGGAGSTSTNSTPTSFAVDDTKPTTNVQVRLGDGTRLVARVNLSHTVGDLRNFVAAARADPRPFILQTTFPNRELSDVSQTIEAAKLQNAVIVQRYT